MHDARAVANFFLDRSWQQGESLTVMTLLKVLYFAHAWHLADTNRPLVAQPFEAWKYGPVCRVVYDQLKGLGRKAISEKLVCFDVQNASFSPAIANLDVSTKLFLENIFDYYSKFHPFVLSDLTHEADSPWHKVWTAAADRAVPGMIIPNELIRTWFRETGGALRAGSHIGKAS